MALELADCCACGEAANVACRLMGSFCGQGGGEEEAGERRRHEAAAVSIGAVAGHANAKAGFPWGRFARQPWPVARAPYLEFWIDDGLGLCGTQEFGLPGPLDGDPMDGSS